MFYDDTYFNQDISSWDVSSVTDMSHMFNYANSFNSDLSTWDVSSVTNMKQMFNAASSFNSDISSWNVSSVTNMFVMFYNVPNFNSDISSWNVSSVINMYGMFHNADNFNSDLSSWDVSSVTNMQQMFQYAGEFNSDISSWDVSSVTNMLQMFSSTNSFNSDLSSWDVSSVTSMNNMFLMASGLSAQNKCLIHTSFSSNANWPYDWSGYCPPSPCGDLVSHDGYDYSIVQIGDQCWFAENCRYLPSVSPSSEGNNTDPYYYVYDYEGVDVAAAKTTSNYESYGVLYNWPAVMAEGICPSGWHIPSDGEWQTMEMSLGMSESEAASEGWRGSPVGDYLKSTYGWNNNGNGNNSSGFNGLPGGYFYFGFDHYGGLGYWWSASEYASENGSFSWFRELYDGSDVVMRSGGSLSGGLSARCIKD
jgi:uncharacterized protein (TIGR02145 family)